jgi:hypothetical protein
MTNRHAFKKTKALIQVRIAELSRPLDGQVQPILARVSPRQPVHPVAKLRQAKGRWYTTHSTINAVVRRYMSTGSSHVPKYNRAAYPKSATATAVSRLTTRAPFASTLRPNLTGGALPRTSGGYSIGNAGGPRYFSHTPAAPAQVVNNVSAAVRAFWLSGQKAHFDGMTPAGEKRYRNVTNLQKEMFSRIESIPRNAPGSFIDFHVNPTVTALSPLGASFPFSSPADQSSTHLNTDGFLDVLSVDFSRALKDLAATLNDLQRLSLLGDLPITLVQKSILRVHFPGCDAETVERLCDEVGIQLRWRYYFHLRRPRNIYCPLPEVPCDQNQATITRNLTTRSWAILGWTVMRVWKNIAAVNPYTSRNQVSAQHLQTTKGWRVFIAS